MYKDNISVLGKVNELAESLGVSSLFAELLLRRGIDTVEAARAFLSPSKDMITDSFELSGIKDAVDRITLAVEKKEKIVIYGDYDCDGILATSILYDYLCSIGADVYYHIPNRFEDGYGLNSETLEYIAESLFPDLIITVDCGISAVEQAEYLAEVLAIDLIVTDHHTLPDVLPNTIVVDPKLDEGHPCMDLCGAGVAFKLVQALAGLDVAYKYIDLAAIATIADIVPLHDENRVIASLGLKKINDHQFVKKGLRMLVESCEVDGKIDSGDVGFRIAPKINAVGRLGDASEIVRLFVSDEYLELQGLVDKLTNANELRKSLVTQIYNEAFEMIKEMDLSMHKVIVLYQEKWNVGIIGLVAARICREFSRPTILLCGEDVLKGSARAPDGIDIYQTIKAASSVLIGFGGHKGAAGLSLRREHLIQARNMMNEYLAETYSDADFIRKENFDLTLSPADITLAFAEELMRLEPTGEGNRKPLFRMDSTQCVLSYMGNSQHAKGRLNECADLVAFGNAYLVDGMTEGVRYDFIAECNKEIFRNRERVQMKLVSAYPSEYDEPNSDPIGFHRYLRSNMYQEARSEFVPIKFDEIKDHFYDDHFGTLFIAFSAKTVSRALAIPQIREKINRVEYAKPIDLAANALVIAPDFIPVAYRKIVLLDTPLNKGYISYLNKHTDAEICVVTDNYPFVDRLSSLDITSQAIERTYHAIRSFVYSGNGASSVVDLLMKIPAVEPYTFISHFYILYDCGAIKIGNGFSMTFQNNFDLSLSVLYRRLLAVKSKYENI